MEAPLLEVFTTIYNEPETVRRLIKWYRDRVPGCAITVFDNESDPVEAEETAKICQKNNVTMHTFSTGGKMDEAALILIRNHGWMTSDAAFVVVCDSDELVDVTEADLIDCNYGEKWNLCKCHGVELFGRRDEDEGRFYGVESEGYSKSVLFHRKSVAHMNFAPGSHTCSPSMNQGYEPRWSPFGPYLFHTKWQDWDEGIARQHAIRDKGIAEDSKQKGWNFHYSLPDSDHKNYFEQGYAKRQFYDTM
jgi:hypothetical protein